MDERRLGPFARTVRAAARAAGERRQAREEEAGQAGEIARGVFIVSHDLEGRVTDGSLYWRGPFQYVMEVMAPRVCADKGLGPEQAEAMAEYMMAAVNEMLVALVAELDLEHFEAWSAAMQAKVTAVADDG